MVRLQRLAQRVHIMACISIICCTVAAQQSASAQASGGVQIVWQKPMDRGADICALSDGGRLAITAELSGTLSEGTREAKIRIRDMMTGDVVKDLVGPVKLCMVFGKDSTTYLTVTGEEPFTISSISTSTGEVVSTDVGASFSNGITAVCPFADRERWAVSSYYGLFICNTMTKQTDTLYIDSSFDTPIGNVRGATWIGISEDETEIYTYGKAGDGDRPIRLCAWEIATRKLIYQKEQTKNFGWVPVSYPRGRYIIGRIVNGGYPDGSKFELYDLRTGELVRHIPKLNPGYAGSFSLTPDGKYLAYMTSYSLHFPVRFVDTETGTVFGSYTDSLPSEAKLIQWLPGSALGVYVPCPGYNSIRLRIDPTTSVQSDAKDKMLHCTVLPNPGDGSVAVNITLAEPAAVTLRLVTSDGKVVQESDLGYMDAGTHTVPARAAAGYYQCTVTAGRASSSFLIIIR